MYPDCIPRGIGTQIRHTSGVGDPCVAANSSVPQVPKLPSFDLDVRNVGDALALLRTVPTASIKLSSWDPQYRQRLTKLAYGNEGMNRGQRRKQLPAMSPAYIASCDAEIGRIMAPPGYCCRWVDVTSCSCHVRGGTTVGSARLNCWPTLQTRREASASLPARVAHRTRPARSRGFPPTGPPKRKNARTKVRAHAQDMSEAKVLCHEQTYPTSSRL